MPHETARHAGIYARQSHAKERSIAQQVTALRKECAGAGWEVYDIYTDRVSASRFTRGDRPDWKRLISDLEAGKLSILVMWESSRGDRDAETWLGLLRRCRERGVLIHVLDHKRTYDISNHRDWRTLAEDGIDNAYESEKTRSRLLRDMAAAAVEGRPHGMAAYGYERIYDPRTRELVRQQPHHEHAPVVREIITRVSRGIPVKTVADWLDEQGIPSPKGGKWGRAIVRNIALNPAYIGKRRWKGQLFDGTWPPLVSEAVFWRAGRVLTDPARKTTRPARAAHLLSYLATCGECGAPVSARRIKGAWYYTCHARSCATITEEYLDEFVGELVAGYLSQPEVLALIGRPDGDEEVLAARAEADALRVRLDEHARMSAAGLITPRSFAVIEAELVPKIEAAEKRAVQAAVPAVLAELAAAADIRAQWKATPLPAQREIVRHLFEWIKVMRRYRARRIAIRWREGPG